MNTGYQPLSYPQVGLATALVLLNGAISLALRLDLGRRLLWASARMTAQLLLIGLVLGWVFARDRLSEVLGLMLAMTAIAGVSAVGRAERRYPGIYLTSLVSVGVGSWVVAIAALAGIVRAEPWYRPQFAIPLLGMILGNTLTGISLGLDRLGGELVARRDQVEALLALGATRWEAARGPIREAVRAGMVPTLNAMLVTGVVSLPGMMTGQLLAGVAPREAVKYQIVIMFLIASGAALGTVVAVLLSYLRLFDADHQFLHRLITDRRAR